MRKLVILGGGESGVGAALLAKKLGISCFVSDSNLLKAPFREELLEHGIPFEEGGHSPSILLEATEVLKSPGIPDNSPVIEKLRIRGIPILSEIEYAYQHFPHKECLLIGITGSNGKTTSVNWLTHILQTRGLDTVMCGNVGRSFARVLASEPLHFCYVVELSSFQLDGIDRFHPDIAILLNITPDHLDRYDHKLERYAASKMRIAKNLSADDSLIYWADDPHISSLIPTSASYTLRPFSSCDATRDEACAYLADGNLHFKGQEDAPDISIPVSDLALEGLHNQLNAMAVATAALELKTPESDLRKALEDFKNVPHRLEFVAEIEGVRYINDSKATNIDSARYALGAQTRPTVLILGGTDKGNDYSEIAELIKDKCKALIFLGLDNSKLHRAFDEEIAQTVDARSMKECIELAYRIASPGDTVLLSPCCASFDLFSNYEDRGDLFRIETLALLHHVENLPIHD